MPSARDEEQRKYEREAARQSAYARNSIQWKVADAKAAGIHPLYAMGSAATPTSPIYTGSAGSTGSTGSRSAFLAGSQGLGRSRMATTTEKAREAQRFELEIETIGLRNDLIRTQIISANRALQDPQVGPSIQNDNLNLVPGQNQSKLGLGGKTFGVSLPGAYHGYQVIPKQITDTARGRRGMDPGRINRWQTVIGPSGRKTRLPSQDATLPTMAHGPKGFFNWLETDVFGNLGPARKFTRTVGTNYLTRQEQRYSRFKSKYKRKWKKNYRGARYNRDLRRRYK